MLILQVMSELAEQRDRRTRTPNKRYKIEEDESATIDVEEDIEIDDVSCNLTLTLFYLKKVQFKQFKC